MTLPVVVELHVDEFALERDPGAARPLADLVEQIAQAAGAPLSLRFRAGLARTQTGPDNLFLRLERQGHEVGTHDHAQDLRAARDAVSSTGVANQGVSPGFVQGDLARLWREVGRLGFRWMTDAPPQRVWAWGGDAPWRPGDGYSPWRRPTGPVSLEVSVTPFQWGLLDRTRWGVVHRQPMGPPELARLAALHTRAATRFSASYFLFTVHEHNFCAPGSLHPSPSALEGFAAFLSRHEVQTAGTIAARCAAEPPWREPTWGERIRRHLPVPEGRPLGALPWACWWGPERPRQVLLVSHAGREGGLTQVLRPLGLPPAPWPDVAVVAWNRAGTGGRPGVLTPGDPAHVEDFRAVYDVAAARFQAPVGALTWSSGLVPALRAGRPLAFLIDAEAPSDRHTLRPPAAPRDPAFQLLDPDVDAHWEGREPCQLLRSCPVGAYHRLQGWPDHVHGRFDGHARQMVAAAREIGLPTWMNGEREPRVLPGPLWTQGHRIGAILGRWMADLAGAARPPSPR